MAIVHGNLQKNIHWSSLREAGTLRGFLFLLWVHRVFGRTIFGVVLYPVMIYFVMFRGVARRSSIDFLATHFQCNPGYWVRQPGLPEVFKHFFAFGQSILDKLLAWSVPMSEGEFDIKNENLLKSFLDDTRGQLIIGSHMGNLEYCRGFVHRYKQKRISILVYDRHAANFVEMMQRINPESRVDVYQVDQMDINMMLALKSKVDSGEWIFIAGDRIPLSGEERTVSVTFMGRRAQLPIGPYMLAKMLQCPVKLMYSYRVKNKVMFEIVPFCEKVVLPRKDKEQVIENYAQKFASELEKQCLEAPFQWFNFYPFWSDRINREIQ